MAGLLPHYHAIKVEIIIDYGLTDIVAELRGCEYAHVNTNRAAADRHHGAFLKGAQDLN
jgi:hypothetical protein